MVKYTEPQTNWTPQSSALNATLTKTTNHTFKPTHGTQNHYNRGNNHDTIHRKQIQSRLPNTQSHQQSFHTQHRIPRLQHTMLSRVNLSTPSTLTQILIQFVLAPLFFFLHTTTYPIFVSSYLRLSFSCVPH